VRYSYRSMGLSNEPRTVLTDMISYRRQACRTLSSLHSPRQPTALSIKLTPMKKIQHARFHCVPVFRNSTHDNNCDGDDSGIVQSTDITRASVARPRRHRRNDGMRVDTAERPRVATLCGGRLAASMKGGLERRRG